MVHSIQITLRDQRWNYLRHILRMEEHRLTRQVLLDVNAAMKLAMNRVGWKANRPSMLRIVRLRGFEEVMFVNSCVRIDLYSDCRGHATLTTSLP